MANIKDLIGAVPVDGDVTPTLRQKIDQVNSNDWSQLPSQDLWEQRVTLMNRMVAAHQTNHPEMVPQIQRGIDYIDQLLRDKEPENQQNMIY